MATIYDVNPNELIEQVATELKKVDTIKAPEWAGFVKTSSGNERPPVREDWWYVRSASVLRHVAIRGPIGTQALRVKYGSNKNRGHKKDRFVRASGNVLRKVLQQLEKSGFLKLEKKAIHRGRIITAKGKSVLDKAAGVVLKNEPKVVKKVEKPVVKKVEEKIVETKKVVPKVEAKPVEKKIEEKSESKAPENKNG